MTDAMKRFWMRLSLIWMVVVFADLLLVISFLVIFTDQISGGWLAGGSCIIGSIPGIAIPIIFLLNRKRFAACTAES